MVCFSFNPLKIIIDNNQHLCDYSPRTIESQSKNDKNKKEK